jgi:hypothetical protein
VVPAGGGTKAAVSPAGFSPPAGVSPRAGACAAGGPQPTSIVKVTASIVMIFGRSGSNIVASVQDRISETSRRRPTIARIARSTRAVLLRHEFTVNDPSTFTKPFTGQLPMTLTDEMVYEYACAAVATKTRGQFNPAASPAWPTGSRSRAGRGPSGGTCWGRLAPFTALTY